MKQVLHRGFVWAINPLNIKALMTSRVQHKIGSSQKSPRTNTNNGLLKGKGEFVVVSIIPTPVIPLDLHVYIYIYRYTSYVLTPSYGWLSKLWSYILDVVL